MQSVQRRFGKFLPRTADESQVSVLLKDFEDADKMLAKVHYLRAELYYRSMLNLEQSDR